jgi:hypothetical protein
MKMFVYSLNSDARRWYRSLSIASLSSLQEFHTTFRKYYERYYSSDILLDDCCEKFKSYIQQTIEYSSCHKLCEDFDEREIKEELILKERILQILIFKRFLKLVIVSLKMNLIMK